mmetsp:Transcript_12693/g.32464  ORF Transcript_12693/g.32464 Transcript_12693/m.32464 type:complete len:217 (-) Transcript_12693:834-1484(-)
MVVTVYHAVPSVQRAAPDRCHPTVAVLQRDAELRIQMVRAYHRAPATKQLTGDTSAVATEDSTIRIRSAVYAAHATLSVTLADALIAQIPDASSVPTTGIVAHVLDLVLSVRLLPRMPTGQSASAALAIHCVMNLVHCRVMRRRAQELVDVPFFGMSTDVSRRVPLIIRFLLTVGAAVRQIYVAPVSTACALQSAQQKYLSLTTVCLHIGQMAAPL